MVQVLSDQVLEEQKKGAKTSSWSPSSYSSSPLPAPIGKGHAVPLPMLLPQIIPSNHYPYCLHEDAQSRR
eukprot:scaffold1634_cov353-Prasinococcus_capsulatus_cf.AAC.2